MRSFPFDSIVEAMGEDGLPIYDRAYSAEDFREVLKTFFTNGVFLDQANAFQVTAGSAMTVTVAPGKGLINGTTCWEQDKRTLEITEAGSYDRIDTVVLRWNVNLEARNIDLYVVKGTEGTNPSRPNLTRTESVYELGIADIFIPRQTTAISNERITDTRPENERCGIVAPFAKIDTTSFYEQLNSAFEELSDELKDQTDKAVELAKSVLDGTTAGHLQNQIDDAVDQLEKINDLTTGINLLRGTRDFVLGTEKFGNTGYFTNGFAYTGGSAASFSKDAEGFSIFKLSTNTQATGSNPISIFSLIFGDFKKDDVITASFEFMIEDVSKVDWSNIVYLCIQPITSGAGQNGKNFTFDNVGHPLSSIENGKWYKAKAVYTIARGLTDNEAIRIVLNNGGKNSIIQFRKVCVQRGNINNPIWNYNPSDPIDRARKLAMVTPSRDTISDCNILVAGLYQIGSSTANKPSGASYGTLFVYANDENTENKYLWVDQMLIDTTGNIWSRQNINQGSWTSWRQILSRDTNSGLAISDGGTGASNLADAKKNLGIQTLGVKQFSFTQNSVVSGSKGHKTIGLSKIDETFLGVVGTKVSSTTTEGWEIGVNAYISGANLYVDWFCWGAVSGTAPNITFTVDVLYYR